MYLSKLIISNYRKYCDNEFEVNFNPDFNLLVGENDSGKTTIIDAIKLVLLTQSREFQSLELEDFYIPTNGNEDQRAKELTIECIFKGFKDEEAQHFLEWLGFDENKDFFLRVFLKGEQDNGKVFYKFRAGVDDEGSRLDEKARDFLRVTYLKPLRDAEYELDSKRNSRISKILYSHKAFEGKEEEHKLFKALKEANEKIEIYFSEDKDGKALLKQINEYLNKFSNISSELHSNIKIGKKLNLKEILEKLNLSLDENKSGLGSQNLLFIAAEFLLLQRTEYTGLKLALIEESESHLHPQRQLRTIEYLQQQSIENNIQLILSTHSPNIASKINLKDLVICKGNITFPMGPKYTKLQEGDYQFLQRFLDVTKSNLFFAQGVIMVEGDSENLLIPSLAEIIDRPLSQYGVSIVNVGISFLRYSRIFLRKNTTNGEMKIPVSVITDCDVRPNLFYDKKNEKLKNDKQIKKPYENYDDAVKISIEKKTTKFTEQKVKTFVSPEWTLEYCIASSCLNTIFYEALLFATEIKKQETNDHQININYKIIKNIKKTVTDDFEYFVKEMSKEDIPFYIYYNLLLTKQISKSITAQYFSRLLKHYKRKNNFTNLKEQIVKDEYLNYLLDAIFYVTKPLES